MASEPSSSSLREESAPSSVPRGPGDVSSSTTPVTPSSSSADPARLLSFANSVSPAGSGSNKRAADAPLVGADERDAAAAARRKADLEILILESQLRTAQAESQKAESLALSARLHRGVKPLMGNASALSGASSVTMGLRAFLGELAGRVAIPEDPQVPVPFPLSALSRSVLSRASELYPDNSGFLQDESLSTSLTSPAQGVSLSSSLFALLQHLVLHLQAVSSSWAAAKAQAVSDGSWASRSQDARDTAERAIAHLSHLDSLGCFQVLLASTLSEGDLPEAGMLVCRVFDSVTNVLRHHGSCPPAGRTQAPIFEAFNASPDLRDALSSARQELRILAADAKAKAAAGKPAPPAKGSKAARSAAGASAVNLSGRALLVNNYINANIKPIKAARICLAFNGAKGCKLSAKAGAPPASASQAFTCSNGWLHQCAAIGCTGFHSLFKVTKADCPFGHAAGVVP